MTDSKRLRPHPRDRFAAPMILLELRKAAAALRAEPHAAVAGHRQVVLFRKGPVSVVLFAFDAGGFLKSHRTDGVVIVQALTGHLHIEAAGDRHEVAADRLLALAPGVVHSVQATEQADMLLTIHKPAR